MNNLLMLEKGIRNEIYYAVNRHVKGNNKYVKDYDKNKESFYLNYRDINYLYGRAMSQNLSAESFKWVENTSQFIKDFIENYHEYSDEVYFLQFDIKYLKKLHDLLNCFLFLPKKKEKLRKFKICCQFALQK